MYLNKQQGFSLVELMISLVLGTLVIAMISSLYVSGIVNNINSIKYSRMKTDLQAVMHLMESDIRRAGYRGDTISYALGTLSGPNKFMWLENTTTTKPDGTVVSVSAGISTAILDHGSKPSSCILFRYDLDKSGGDIGSNEHFGYRLSSGAIQMTTNSSYVNYPTNCDGTTWETITDPNFITISDLKFENSLLSTSVYSRMRVVKITLEGQTTLGSKTVTEKLESHVQVRNMEMFQ
ncbi:prepilin-type N-terminal cleavage/methylation domain-containing protein [Motilimonas sp. KMU-193]|uniref:prepilin-type N-terminal cleavage/methylation domain-containing protein n=1 Tax=Motilimonas sp. KMU-193 TaxID=3388668 RepID=UPI00396AEFDA